MMILRSAPASPFARKIRIAASLAGLADQLTVVDADTASDTDSLRRENPLGKIPTLVLADGTTYFDSRVIIDYLDHVSGGGVLVPAEPEARLRSLTLQALGDGIMDAAILIVYEARWREEAVRVARWTDYQGAKIFRTLEVLEDAPPAGAIAIGHIALACALGYLDLRLGGTWRPLRPRLVAWLDAFAAEVPAFEATRFMPPG